MLVDVWIEVKMTGIEIDDNDVKVQEGDTLREAVIDYIWEQCSTNEIDIMGNISDVEVEIY